MKCFKILSILAVATLLLVPATAMARTHLSFSLNLLDRVCPVLAPPPVVIAPAPPVYYYAPYPAPYYLPPAEPRTIVKEYHHYYPQRPVDTVEEITTIHRYPSFQR
jgi:hypothetical protein